MDMGTDTDMTNSPVRLTVIVSLIIGFIASSAVFAQQTVPGSAISSDAALASANNQTSSSPSDSESSNQPSRAIIITPRIALTETWSDNVNIFLGGAGNSKESGLITQLTPGIRAQANTVRLKAYFDYSLSEFI